MACCMTMLYGEKIKVASGGATGWTGGDESPPFVTEANFLIRPNPVRKGGGYDSGIKSRNTGLGKFQNKRHSCSNIYINMQLAPLSTAAIFHGDAQLGC